MFRLPSRKSIVMTRNDVIATHVFRSDLFLVSFFLEISARDDMILNLEVRRGSFTFQLLSKLACVNIVMI